MSPASYLTAPPRVAYGDYSGCLRERDRALVPLAQAAQRLFEVSLRDRACVLGAPAAPGHRRQRRLLRERLQVRRREAVGRAGELLEVDADGRHPRRVETRDREPAGLVRQAEHDRPREAPAAEDRRVELVGTVGRSDYEHAALACDPVDLR